MPTKPSCKGGVHVFASSSCQSRLEWLCPFLPSIKPGNIAKRSALKFYFGAKSMVRHFLVLLYTLSIQEQVEHNVWNHQLLFPRTRPAPSCGKETDNIMLKTVKATCMLSIFIVLVSWITRIVLRRGELHGLIYTFAEPGYLINDHTSGLSFSHQLDTSALSRLKCRTLVRYWLQLYM